MNELRSTLPASTLRAESQDMGMRVHTVSEPSKQQRLNEQEWHQHAARYAACGMEPREIAEACEVTVKTIYDLQTTPWFQERVTALMAALDTDVMEMFKGMRVGAIMRLGQLAHGAKSEVVQLGAIKEILDRNFGKSVQKVEQDTTVRSANPVDEAAALMQSIQQTQVSLGLNPGTRSASAEGGTGISIGTTDQRATLP